MSYHQFRTLTLQWYKNDKKSAHPHIWEAMIFLVEKCFKQLIHYQNFSTNIICILVSWSAALNWSSKQLSWNIKKPPKPLSWSCGGCRLITCSLVSCCFHTLWGPVCSRPLRCGNYMTNCTDVCQNRVSLMLLNKGFPFSSDDASDQTQKDRFTQTFIP